MDVIHPPSPLPPFFPSLSAGGGGGVPNISIPKSDYLLTPETGGRRGGRRRGRREKDDFAFHERGGEEEEEKLREELSAR